MQYIEDFTSLPAGTISWPEGQVERCPMCGRTGIEQIISEHGARVFVHAQSSEILSDGMLVEPQECCTVTEVPVLVP